MTAAAVVGVAAGTAVAVDAVKNGNADTEAIGQAVNSLAEGNVVGYMTATSSMAGGTQGGDNRDSRERRVSDGRRRFG